MPAVSDKFFQEETLSKEEQEAESMISLINEMRALQMRNKNDSSLTDEQRRKGAEDMMKRLAAVMNVGDDSYGEDNGDGAEGLE